MQKNIFPLLSTKIASKSEAEKRFQQLEKEIDYHNNLYFTLDAPEISDDAFDALVREKNLLIAEYSLSSTEYIAPEVVSLLEKGEHRQKMYSLDKAHTREDVDVFIQRLQKEYPHKALVFWADVKLDGIAVELIYEQGILTKALTRGDGTVGEVITHTVRTIPSIPKELAISFPPAYLEVRGEIVLSREAFHILNEEQIATGKKPFANPRNAASGSIRQLDASVTQGRGLEMYAYGIGEIEGETVFALQSELMHFIQNIGFSLPEKSQCIENLDTIWEYYHNILENREAFPYEIDGLVLKLNELSLHKALGYTAKSPRFALALKFPARYAETLVTDIVVHIGRTGVLTPVAHLQPVEVGGVMVSRATLHNKEEIEAKDIRIGDAVLLKRAGDVIPYIVNSIPEKRSTESIPFIFPTVCPECGTAVFSSEAEVAVYCPNIACPAVAVQRIIHFISKGGFDIQGFGKKWVAILYKEGLLCNPADIFTLQYSDLCSLERMGEVSAKNLIQAIGYAKEQVTLAKYIYALGIRHIGEQTAKALAERYTSMNALRCATEEELQHIDDVGVEMARSLCVFFTSETTITLLETLYNLGIDPIVVQKERSTQHFFSGKRLLFTGTLAIPRDTAEGIVENYGAIVCKSISAKVDILVAGENAGSKLVKAEKLGIYIMGEEEFMEHLH